MPLLPVVCAFAGSEEPFRGTAETKPQSKGRAKGASGTVPSIIELLLTPTSEYNSIPGWVYVEGLLQTVLYLL